MQIIVAEAVKSKSTVLAPDEGLCPVHGVRKEDEPNLSGDEMPFCGHLLLLTTTASLMRPELSRPNLKSPILI